MLNENIIICGHCEDCGCTYHEERYFWYDNEGLLADNLCVGCEVDRYIGDIYEPVGCESRTEPVDVGRVGGGRRDSAEAVPEAEAA